MYTHTTSDNNMPTRTWMASWTSTVYLSSTRQAYLRYFLYLSYTTSGYFVFPCLLFHCSAPLSPEHGRRGRSGSVFAILGNTGGGRGNGNTGEKSGDGAGRGNGGSRSPKSGRSGSVGALLAAASRGVGYTYPSICSIVLVLGWFWRFGGANFYVSVGSFVCLSVLRRLRAWFVPPPPPPFPRLLFVLIPPKTAVRQW